MAPPVNTPPPTMFANLMSMMFASYPTDDIREWVLVPEVKPTPIRRAPLPIGHTLTETDVSQILGNDSLYTGYNPELSSWDACLPTGWRTNVATGGADKIADASLRVVRIGEWYYVVRHEPAIANKVAFTHLTVLVWRIVDYNTDLNNACLAGNK